MAVRKGDLLRYTGPYADEVPPSAYYSNGRAVAFRNYREKVTVELVDGSGYADWPMDQVEHVPEVQEDQ